MRRHAMSMAVLAQVNIAHQRYALVSEEYRLARKLNDVDNRLSALMSAEKTAGRINELAVIQSATNALLSSMRHHLAYAELQNAAGRIYNSIGLDPLPAGVETLDIKALSDELKESFKEWKSAVNKFTSD